MSTPQRSQGYQGLGRGGSGWQAEGEDPSPAAATVAARSSHPTAPQSPAQGDEEATARSEAAREPPYQSLKLRSKACRLPSGSLTAPCLYGCLARLCTCACRRSIPPACA